MTIARVLVAALLFAAGEANCDEARDILRATGVQGGLVVHLGCGDGRLTATLRVNEGYLVQGLDRDPGNVDKARAYLQSLDQYGPATVELWVGPLLPYEDNMVNLLVVEDVASTSMTEILRVLVPHGVAYIRRGDTWDKTVKPVRPEMDEWTHYLHDPSNNAVSSDTLVAAPHQLRWVGSPNWVRHHDHMASLVAMVSARGRLFYILDEGNMASMQFPAHWSVIARDAYNGTVLWKRSIEQWVPSVWPGKNGPARLPRRLVAQGDRVYVTLGIEAPLSELDAATGETIRTYEGTAATEEVLCDDGTLFVVVNRTPVRYPDPSFPGLLHDSQTPAITQYIGNHYPPSSRVPWIHPDIKGLPPRDVVALDAQTGAIKWQYTTTPLKLTLAADKKGVYFHDGTRIVCLDRETGQQRWASAPIARNPLMYEAFGPTLVVQKGVVLFASAENMTPAAGANDTLTALSAEMGEKLWNAPHPPSGYCSPEDTFVVNGCVWTPETSNRKNSGTFTARDLLTGEVRASFPGDDGVHMPHHRCYRAKATECFFLMSRTGIEFVDPREEHWDRNDWVRGSCLLGIMPANGLVYAGPHSCSCYIESKLDGLCALTAARSPEAARQTGPGGARWLKGPAWSSATAAEESDPGDWPTYRQNPARTGTTKISVSAHLKPAWTTRLGGCLSSPVVAGKRLFVAAIDTHTVYAVDIESGAVLWHFTAGGRVDSPPTVWHGLAIFGSADGCVYGLRATDGALAWRFRASPVDRRIVAFEQLESQWPLHGSVLIREGVVHCVAGRSMFLDGGIRYLRLDAATGALLSEELMDDRDPETGKDLDADVRWPRLPVTLPDILSCDGVNIYMRAQALDLQGKRKPKGVEVPHLFSPTGFQDGGTWWHRTYWVYAKEFGYGTGYKVPASVAPAGRILVLDDKNVYGFAAKPPHFYQGWTMSWYEYQLFGMKRTPERGLAPPPQDVHIAKAPPAAWVKYTWTRDLPCLVRGLVLAGDKLFVAGVPRLLDERKSLLAPEDPDIRTAAAAQEAAWAGHRGSLLLAVDPADGQELSQLVLAGIPTWDGLIAAQGSLFVSTLDGTVVRLGSP